MAHLSHCYGGDNSKDFLKCIHSRYLVLVRKYCDVSSTPYNKQKIPIITITFPSRFHNAAKTAEHLDLRFLL